MKRKDLIKRLIDAGCVFVRPGARHADGGREEDAERSERPTAMVGISRQVRGSVRRLTFSGSLVT